MLIGIQSSTGARSGKDTVADMIQKELNIGRYAFAKPIKESMNELFAWDERHEDGALKEVILPTFLPSTEQWIEIAGNFYRKHPKLNSIGEVKAAGIKIESVFTAWCYENGRVVMTVDEQRDTKGFNRLLHISPREVYQLFGTELMRDCVSDSFWTDIAPKENVIITDVRFSNEVSWLDEHKGILVDVVREGNVVKVATHSSESGTGATAYHTICNSGTLEMLDDEVHEFLNSLRNDGIYF
jgi:hypothetical protein